MRVEYRRQEDLLVSNLWRRVDSSSGSREMCALRDGTDGALTRMQLTSEGSCMTLPALIARGALL
jgi:hypothetical protein